MRRSDRHLNEGEVTSLADLRNHPGWGVFKGLFDDKIQSIYDNLLLKDVDKEESYQHVQQIKSLTRIKDELLSLPDEAARETSPLTAIQQKQTSFGVE